MSAHVVSGSITVNAPPDVVFSILADPRQHTRVDGSGTVRAAVRGPERLEKGARFGMDMKMFGLPYKIKNTVVEFDEGRLIAWRHFGGHRWRYQLTPTGNGTEVTESFDYSMYSPTRSRLIETIGFPGRNRRAIAETLERLRSAAEEDAR